MIALFLYIGFIIFCFAILPFNVWSLYDLPTLFLCVVPTFLFAGACGEWESFQKGLKDFFCGFALPAPSQRVARFFRLLAWLCIANGVFWAIHGGIIMMSDYCPELIAVGTAVCLLSVLYGVFAAAFVCLPISLRFQPKG